MEAPRLKFHPNEFSVFCHLINSAVLLYAEQIAFSSNKENHRTFLNLVELQRINAVIMAKLALTYRKSIKIKLTHDHALTLMECVIPSQNNSYKENMIQDIKGRIHHHYYASVEGDIEGLARSIMEFEGKTHKLIH